MWAFGVLTTAKAEEECDINKGVGSSKNLRKRLVKTLEVYDGKEMRTETKEARAQRLHTEIVRLVSFEQWTFLLTW